jgi:hypothetical protein
LIGEKIPMPFRNRPWGLIAAALVLSMEIPAFAEPRAAYLKPEDLKKEGLPHQLDVSMLSKYAHVFDAPTPTKPLPLANQGSFVLRNRLALGRNPHYCLGLDGEIGGSNAGIVYGASAYVAGTGLRWNNGNLIAICGGVGVDGVKNAVPFAVRYPAELRTELSMGPIRTTLWARTWWLANPKERQEGSSTLSFVDEMDAGLLFRFGKQHRYWSRVNAGGGLAIGVLYREFMGARSLGVVLGLNLSGAQ